jgi:septum formation inhibitor-activating ATPase MinD
MVVEDRNETVQGSKNDGCVERVLLTDNFDYVVLDSPAGIESGVRQERDRSRVQE